MKNRRRVPSSGVFGELPVPAIPMLNLAPVMTMPMVPMPPMPYTMPAGIAPSPPPPAPAFTSIPGFPPADLPMPSGLPVGPMVPGSVPPTGGVLDPMNATVPVVTLSKAQVYFANVESWKTRPLWQVLIEQLLGLYPNPLGESASEQFRNAYLTIREFEKDQGLELEHERLTVALARRASYVPDSLKQAALDALWKERQTANTGRVAADTLRKDAVVYISYYNNGQSIPTVLQSKFTSYTDALTKRTQYEAQVASFTPVINDLSARIAAIETVMSNEWKAYIGETPEVAEVWPVYREMVVTLAKEHPQALLRAMKRDIEGAIIERDAVMASLIREREATIKTDRDDFIALFQTEADLYLNNGGLRDSMARSGKALQGLHLDLREKSDALKAEAESLKSAGPELQAWCNVESAKIKDSAGVFNQGQTAANVDWLKEQIGIKQFTLQGRTEDFKRRAEAFPAWVDAQKAKIDTEQKLYEYLKQLYGERMNYVTTGIFQRQVMAMFNDRKKFLVTHDGLQQFIPAYFAGISYLFKTAADLWDFRYMRGRWAFLKFHNEDYAPSTWDVASQIRQDLIRFKKEHPEAFTGETWNGILRFARDNGWTPMADTEYRAGSTEYRMQTADNELKTRVTQYEMVFDRAEVELISNAGGDEINVEGFDDTKKLAFYNLSVKFLEEISPVIKDLIKESRALAEKFLIGEGTVMEKTIYEKARRLVVSFGQAKRLVEKLKPWVVAGLASKTGVSDLSYEGGPDVIAQ